MTFSRKGIAQSGFRSLFSDLLTNFSVFSNLPQSAATSSYVVLVYLKFVKIPHNTMYDYNYSIFFR